MSEAHSKTHLDSEINISELNIIGNSRGNEIWMVKTNGINLFSTFVHEVGHFLGKGYSFANKDVLTPDEIKETTLDLSDAEKFKLERILLSEDMPTDVEEEFVIEVAYKFLEKFTRGCFDRSGIVTHFNLTKEEMMVVVSNDPINTIEMNEDGTFVYKNTRRSRNSELPSLTTEISGLEVVQNTIRTVDPSFYATLLFGKSPSHNRAHKIVDRAFAGRNWRLPSDFDLEKPK